MNETGNGSGGIRQSVTKIVVLKEVFLMLKNHHMNGLLCLCLMLAQTYYKNKKCSFFFFFWYTCSRQYFHIFMSLLYGLGQKGICSKPYTNLTFPKKLFLLTTKNMVYLTAYDFCSPCSKLVLVTWFYTVFTVDCKK